MARISDLVGHRATTVPTLLATLEAATGRKAVTELAQIGIDPGRWQEGRNDTRQQHPDGHVEGDGRSQVSEAPTKSRRDTD